MGTGWKTYFGISIIALAIVGKVLGVELPTIDHSTDIGVLVGQAIALFGLRDKLGKL